MGSVVELRGEFADAVSTSIYRDLPTPPSSPTALSPVANSQIEEPPLLPTTWSKINTLSDEGPSFTQRLQKRLRSPTLSSTKGPPKAKRQRITLTPSPPPPPPPPNTTRQNPQPLPATQGQGQECCCPCHTRASSTPVASTEPPRSKKGRRRKRGKAECAA